MNRNLNASHWTPDESLPVLRMTVGEALRVAAADVPTKSSLVSVAPGRTARTWTYSELLDDAESTGRWLAERFSPGEHIAVWAPNVPEWLILQYGAALAGLVLVTVNPATREQELRYAVSRSDAVALFYVGSVRGTDTASMAEDSLSDMPQVREMIRLETLFEHIREAGPRELPEVSPADTVQIQFTSGTTGLPKPAMLTHEAMVTNAAHVRARCLSDPSVVYGTALPLFHTAGSGLACIGSVCHRATLVLAEVFEPEAVLRSIEEYSVVAFGGVPTMLHALYANKDKVGADLSSLEVLMSGGDLVPAPLIEAWESAGVKGFSSVYGQTELSPIVCQTSATDSLVDRRSTSGLPLPQTEVAVVDPVSDEITPPGVEGEIRVRGYLVMRGYYRMPEATAEVIDESGWLRTGDLGTMDQRGYVTVTGRLKDMVIRGGENIYPREIETVLTKHPGIEQAAVIGEADDYWGETVTAIVTPTSESARPTAEELHEWMRERLAPHKTPTKWLVAETLPRNAMGKLQKFRLQEQIADNGLDAL